MGAYQKQRWRQALNEYRFAKEEIDIIKSTCREAAPLFEEYYRQFLLKNNIDLDALNRQHAATIRKAYNLEEEEKITGGMPVTGSTCTDLILSQQLTVEDELARVREDDTEVHGIFAKLFKKIALKIHPDKIDVLKHSFAERRKMGQDFKKANQALSNKDYFILLEIAEELDIALPRNYNQQTRWIKNELQALRTLISQEKLTYNYVFSQAESDEMKDNIIRQFVNQLFSLQLS